MRLAFLLISLMVQSVAAQERQSVSIAVFAGHDEYVRTSSAYGVSWQLLVQIADSLHIDLNPVELTWAASVERMDQGKVPLVFGALYTKPRAQKWFYSYSFAPDISAIYVYPGSGIDSWGQLKRDQVTIGVAANTMQQGLAETLGFTQVYGVEDTQGFHKMLRQRRLDAVLVAESFIGYYCLVVTESSQKTCLHRVSESLDRNHTHIVANLKNASAVALVHQINQALVSLAPAKKAADTFIKGGYSEEDVTLWRKVVAQQHATNKREQVHP